jgi:hypothetical protein
MDNTFYIKVTTKGKDPMLWLKEVNDKVHFEFQEILVELGIACAEKMREVIRGSLKRVGSTGLLENSIQSELLTSTGGVTIGIGRISDLPPYWEVLNAGGYVPPRNKGFFASGLGMSGQKGKPVSGAGGESWIHTGDSSDYLLTPKKPIDPVRYIDISAEELKVNIQIQLAKLMKESK